jgi:hypothetical protein
MEYQEPSNFISLDEEVFYKHREFWVGKLVYLQKYRSGPFHAIILKVERCERYHEWAFNGEWRYGIKLKILDKQKISYLDITWDCSGFFRNLVDEQDKILYTEFVKCNM